MPTPRETILSALYARLSILRATVLRGEVLPERVPSEGLLMLRDGEPGDPEVTLSPLCYHYQHRAEIEAVVQGIDRDVTFDTLCASIGAAIATDRTLIGRALRLDRGRSTAARRSPHRGWGDIEGCCYSSGAALWGGGRFSITLQPIRAGGST